MAATAARSRRFTYERAKKTRQDISLESGTNLDTAYIRDLIDQTARACASEKVDPTVTVDADAKTVTVVTGSPKNFARRGRPL